LFTFPLSDCNYKSHPCKQVSFSSLPYWKQFVEQRSPPELHNSIVLVGNKCDLVEKRRVSYERGKALADEFGWPFFETSAKENVNVIEAFIAAARIGLSGGCMRAHAHARDAAAPYSLHEEPEVTEVLQSLSHSGKRSQLDLQQPIAVSGQQADAVSSATLQDFQIQLKQLQQAFDSVQQLLKQQQCTGDQSPHSHKPYNLTEPVAPTARTKFDISVMLLIFSAIVVFAAYQIRSCVDSYATPIIQSSTLLVNRTFPGLMICPFTDGVQNLEDFNEENEDSRALYQVYVYPSNAVLSSRIDDLVYVDFTSIDKVSKLKRKKCVSDDPDDFWPPYPWPRKYVAIQNSAPNQFASDSEWREFYLSHCLDENCTSSVKSGTFSSGTAPNVECMVYDPSFFTGVSQGCNPMVETNPNALDSIIVDFGIYRYFSFHMSEILRLNFDYAAMNEIPFPPFPHDEDPSFGPITNFSHSIDLTNPPSPLPLSPIDHLFSGLVAVMYDSARGIPPKLDFSGARYNEMSDDPQHILSSRVVMRKECDETGCWMQPINRIAALASSVVENSFQNAITGTLIKETFEGILIQPDEVISGDTVVLEISFASSSTLVLTPFISVTILSVISLIFSTSVSLWGIQEDIKLKLILVWSKTKPFWKKHLWKVLVPKFHQNTHCDILTQFSF
jgi:hypothetical protein